MVFIGESDGPFETGIDLVQLDFVWSCRRVSGEASRTETAAGDLAIHKVGIHTGDCLFGEGSAARLFSRFEITGDRVGLLEVVDETL